MLPLQRNRKRASALLIAMLTVVLVVPTALGRNTTPEPFDTAAVGDFESADAEIVFLGNSLLNTRIDPEYLGELSGIKTTSLATDGTGPGIWYLQLGNLIGASSKVPATVFIFFHDDLITRPIAFTGAEDQALVERLTPTDIAGTGFSSLNDIPTRDGVLDKIRNTFKTVYPLTESSPNTNSSVSSVAAFVAGIDKKHLTEDADSVFDYTNKRDQAQIIQQPMSHGSFEHSEPYSYLSPIIDVAMTIGVDLVFVRVSARPNNDGSPNEPESLSMYSAELSEFLQTRGIRYIDMTGHLGIDAGIYYDGYHLSHRFRGHYTELFAEWMLTDGISDS